jgi:hypothetical protein
MPWCNAIRRIAPDEPTQASLATALAMIHEMGYGRREGEVVALEKDLGVAT